MRTFRTDLWRRRVGGIAVLIAGVCFLGAGAVKRAKPPEWTKNVSDVFFPDARTRLEGQRPAPGAARPVAAGATSNPVAGMDAGDAASGGGSYTWSKLIDADSVEDEIKSLQKQYGEKITQPSPFKGGGYKDARRLLSELAVLFAIIGEYDGDIRWKKEGPSMRDLLGRTSNSCKVGSDASYNEAKLRKDELETLIRGGGTTSVPNVEAKADWAAKVAGRPPLMQRLEELQQKGVAPGISNADEFRKQQEKILVMSQLIAALGEVIQQPGYESADEEEYLGFAKQMRDAAAAVGEAVKNKNYDAARAASGKIDKACAACHESYRS